MKEQISINEEREFQIEELFFSTTDLNGKITSGNEVFTRISGYETGEILGKPHSLIRHADMPRVVFRLLWDRIQAGSPIAAYVKNRAKNGSYYWVLAFVSPIPNGYLSVRFKPTTETLNVVTDLYKVLRKAEIETEQQAGMTKEDAIQRSSVMLHESLHSLGFKDYDAFIEATFFCEFCKRRDLCRGKKGDVRPGSYESVVQILKTLSRKFGIIFDKKDQFISLNDRIADATEFVRVVSESIRLAALNLTIKSERLSSANGPLSVISEWLLHGSHSLSENLDSAIGPILDELEQVRRGLFSLACSQLQIDMIEYFVGEFETLSPMQRGYSDQEGAELIRLLIASAHSTYQHSVGYLSHLSAVVKSINESFDGLHRDVLSLGLAQVNGKVESTRLDVSGRLEGILEEVVTGIENAESKLSELGDGFQKVERVLKDFGKSSNEIKRGYETLVHQRS
ncbi:MAG: PAS domain-containing protein [Bdellovibrionales bacterium]|nr:PAS domain-containing protein [Bdellovibrionales bacterium]